MEGYRVLESGDLRISESGDSRVTEGFIEGFVGLTADANLSVSSVVNKSGAVNLTTVGSTLLAGEAVLFGRTELTSSSNKDSVGNLIASGSLVEAATSTASVSAIRIRHGATSLSSDSSMASKAGFKFAGASYIQAEGSFSATPKFTAQGLFGSFGTDVERLTESGDVRITEDGNVRIVDFYQPNFADAAIYSTPTKIVFVSEPYAKYLSDWRKAVPYVKYEGDWIKPQKAYKHLDGRWKRIY